MAQNSAFRSDLKTGAQSECMGHLAQGELTLLPLDYLRLPS